MSHITKYIDKSISILTPEEIQSIYLETYPLEDPSLIRSAINLSRNFESGGFIEDEFSYIIVFVPATINTIIIKQKYENYKL